MKTLILGGIKSGKSRLAETHAANTGKRVIYIATATANDDEMHRRIEHHRESRPSHWQVVEEPLNLAMAISTHSNDDTCVLVDCLTLWLTNVLLSDSAGSVQHQSDGLLQAVKNTAGPVVMVSNETSMGIVPVGELTRQFCDVAGLLHQQLATACDNVILTVAGLPQYLKGSAGE